MSGHLVCVLKTSCARIRAGARPLQQHLCAASTMPAVRLCDLQQYQAGQGVLLRHYRAEPRSNDQHATRIITALLHSRLTMHV